jgi:hypothetical protein
VRADVSAAFSRPASLRVTLRECVDAIVRHIDAAFARIWTLNKDQETLELQASAGIYTHLDGPPHSRVQVGKLKIGALTSGTLLFLSPTWSRQLPPTRTAGWRFEDWPTARSLPAS